MINFYDEEFGFTLEFLDKETTNLPVNIYLDGFGKFRKIENNISLIYIQNNYNIKRTDQNLIPITISKDPKFLEEPTYIFQEDREIIIEWVKKYYEILMKHWDKKIGIFTIFDILECEEIDKKLYSLNECQLLFEMSNLLKDETKLPMNIWLDEGGSKRNIPHNFLRLKFQPNTSSNMYGFENWISISIDEKNPKILTNSKYKLKNKEITQLKEWIIKNYDNLIKLYNGGIDFKEFRKLMKYIQD